MAGRLFVINIMANSVVIPNKSRLKDSPTYSDRKLESGISLYYKAGWLMAQTTVQWLLDFSSNT